MTPGDSSGGTWTIAPNTEVDDQTPLTPFHTGDRTTPWTSSSARFTESLGYSYPDVQDWLPRTPEELSANVTARVNELYNPDGILTRRSVSSHSKRATEKLWSVTVSVPNAAVGEGFFVDVSVGDITVGKLVVLSPPSQAELDAGAHKITYGEYPLSAGLTGISEDKIPEYLKESLKWKVTKIVSFPKS